MHVFNRSLKKLTGLQQQFLNASLAQLTWQKWYELVEERHAFVATLGLRAAALLQEPQDHVAEAESLVGREAPGGKENSG